jgi:hypothetical protein
VREQPLDLPSREVVAAGTKLGLKLSQGLVRVIRFHLRHPRPGGHRATRREAGRSGRSQVAASAPGAAEVQFRKLVLELGVARAKALVSEVEAAIERLVSG